MRFCLETKQCRLIWGSESLSIFKETVIGLFKGAEKVAKGLGQGLEEGIGEITGIPANIKEARREAKLDKFGEKLDKFSGEYTIDITKGRWGEKQVWHNHKQATIILNGRLRSIEILKRDGNSVDPDDWINYGAEGDELKKGNNRRNSEVWGSIEKWYEDFIKDNGLTHPQLD